jgi:putative ABC transport system ATP-binding protein
MRSDLSLSFDTPGLRINSLRSTLAGPFDLELAPGEILAISGASGSGKSLFLRMVADLDPNEGGITLDGVSRSGLAANVWRRLVPYVAAESGWWADTVHEHFAEDQRDTARRLANRLGVKSIQFDGLVNRLSTGERQRLALVRGLIINAPVTLLDEPTGPLDPVSVRSVEEVLAERAAGGAIIVLVSHDPLQGGRLGARRLQMVDGTLQKEE